MSVEEAKEVLKQNGYFVDNLWSVDDVQLNWKCDEDTAQEVLIKALTNEWVVEQIFFAIGEVADNMQLERLEDLD
jgi:hypothetical protein